MENISVTCTYMYLGLRTVIYEVCNRATDGKISGNENIKCTANFLLYFYYLHFFTQMGQYLTFCVAISGAR